MNLPLHCQPPMPDWGFGKKEQRIPTEDEIVAKFGKDEKIKIAYTSSLLVRLLRYFAIDEVVLYLKYPRRPEYKKHTHLLQQLCIELDKDSVKAHQFESIKWLDACFHKFKKDCRADIQKLEFATQSALMRVKKEHSYLQVGIQNALLVIGKINKHGAYVSRVVAERSGIECQEFQPSQPVVLIKALLVDMADKLDCECEHSSDMHLALDILVKKYLEILKV